MLISRLILFLEKYASLKRAVFLMMLIIPINAIVFPLINEELTKLSGYGRLDSLFTYSPALLFSRLEAYTETGRTIYLFSIPAIDFLYPILYTLLLSFLLTLLLQTAFPATSPLLRMQLFPFGMLVFSYLENISLIILLLLYPSQPTILAQAASTLGTLRWCFGAFSVLALLSAIIRMIIMLAKPNPTRGEKP